MRLRVLLCEVLVFAGENTFSLFFFRIPTRCNNLTNGLIVSLLISLLSLFEMVDWLLVVVIEVQE